LQQQNILVGSSISCFPDQEFVNRKALINIKTPLSAYAGSKSNKNGRLIPQTLLNQNKAQIKIYGDDMKSAEQEDEQEYGAEVLTTSQYRPMTVSVQNSLALRTNSSDQTTVKNTFDNSEKMTTPVLQ
jgi:hypothetical protein